MTDLVFHFVLFTLAGVGLVAAPMILGKLLRPTLPTPQKDSVYECGEATIGSSFIQFDLRFYTVALLFIVFDVEVAFFFPWSTIYGNFMQLTDTRLADSARMMITEKVLNQPAGSLPASEAISAATALQFGWFAFADILVFFGVLLVGFAYVWKRGDLEWVKVMPSHRRKGAAAAAAVTEAT